MTYYKNTCGYRCMGLNDKCKYLQTIMEGWELGQQDTHEPTSEDLEEESYHAAMRMLNNHDLILSSTTNAQLCTAYQKFYKEAANWQKEKMIDKACEWLYQQQIVVPNYEEFIEGFRKAMEAEKW